MVAIAISIALHEIAAGLIPGSLGHSTSNREMVTRARIMRVAARRVAPPNPRPRPARIVKQFHAHVVAGLRPVRSRAGGSGRHLASHLELSPQVRLAQSSAVRPVWDAAAPGANSGALLAASGNGHAGKGSGAAGNGSNAAGADQPCGFVTFSDPHGSHYDSRTRGFWVDIRMSVRFADGSSQSLILDYPWYYPSEVANPWSDQNLKDPNFPTRFQSPPPAQAQGEPALVKYVMNHSTPEGMTLLADCPQTSPTPNAGARNS